MKLRVHTCSDGWQELEVSDGLLEVKGVPGMDPDLQPRFRLSEILGLELSGHPEPVVQEGGPLPPETEWDESSYGSDGNGGFALVGKQKIVKRRVPRELLPKGLREPYPGTFGAPRLPKAKTRAKETA
jgi:hypothetical protein